jgi:hypothetical protein
MKCYEKAEDKYNRNQVKIKLRNEQNKTNCNCLPACNSLSYDVKTSEAEFDYKNLFKEYRKSEEIEG